MDVQEPHRIGALTNAQPAMIQADWPRIRALCEAGEPIKEVGARFGVSSDVIRQRGKNEQWATPRRVAKRVRELQAQGAAATGVEQGRTIDDAVAMWEKRREEYKGLVHAGVSKALEEFFNDPVRSQVRGWDDAKKAADIVKPVVGLDRSENLGDQAGAALNLSVGVLVTNTSNQNSPASTFQGPSPGPRKGAQEALKGLQATSVDADSPETLEGP